MAKNRSPYAWSTIKPTDPVVPDEPDPGTPDKPGVPGTPDPDAPGAPTPDERNGLSNQAPFPADAAGHHLPRTSRSSVATIRGCNTGSSLSCEAPLSSRPGAARPNSCSAACALRFIYLTINILCQTPRQLLRDSLDNRIIVGQERRKTEVVIGAAFFIMPSCGYNCINCGRCKGKPPKPIFVPVCIYCGNTNPLGSEVCSRCGKSLKLIPGTTNTANKSGYST